jgi:hypothetical protein
VLDCNGGGQEKWSSGLQEASPTDHNGDVPNGYVRWARTPLRQWLVRSDPDFSDPDFSNPSQSESRF